MVLVYIYKPNTDLSLPLYEQEETITKSNVGQNAVVSRNRLSSLFVSEGKEDSPRDERVKVGLGSQMDDKALKDEPMRPGLLRPRPGLAWPVSTPSGDWPTIFYRLPSPQAGAGRQSSSPYQVPEPGIFNDDDALDQQTPKYSL
ncbi:hypothetical protein K1719_045466 [Acacia pycnantha]|nr:hypothetical protein K1719_045466 [Acacia pycnantha]